MLFASPAPDSCNALAPLDGSLPRLQIDKFKAFKRQSRDVTASPYHEALHYVRMIYSSSRLRCTTVHLMFKLVSHFSICSELTCEDSRVIPTRANGAIPLFELGIKLGLNAP